MKTTCTSCFGFLVHYWYIALVWVLMVVAGGVYNAPLAGRIQIASKPAWQIFLTHSVLMTVAVFLFIGGVKGGFRHSTRPITLSNAGEYVDKPKEMFIVLNTPFCIFKTLKKSDYQRADFFRTIAGNERRIIHPIHTPRPECTRISSEKCGNPHMGKFREGNGGNV
jgi:hypothetical protein